MAYYNTNDVVETPEEFFNYLTRYGIITDATFSDLNDESYTDSRLAPYRDYLDKMNIQHSFGGDMAGEYGPIYFEFDEKRFNPLSAAKEAKEIAKLYLVNNPNL